MEKSAAVFLGEVISVESHMSQSGGTPHVKSRTYTFMVMKSWKGVEGDTVTVSTAGSEAGCGVHFQKGIPYMVYADMKDGNGILSTHLCTRTHPASSSADMGLLDGTTSLDIIGSIGSPSESPSGVLMRVINREEAPIYVLGGAPEARAAQIWSGKEWLPYAPNVSEKPRAEFSEDLATLELAAWKEAFNKIDPRKHMTRVDPGKAFMFFVAPASQEKKWRVGCRYLTFDQLGEAVDVKKDGNIVWSLAVDPKVKLADCTSLLDQVKGN